ncbi:MAG: hypothetical protein WC977_12400 [Anaerovoracaceae bacterium]
MSGTNGEIAAVIRLLEGLRCPRVGEHRLNPEISDVNRRWLEGEREAYESVLRASVSNLMEIGGLDCEYREAVEDWLEILLDAVGNLVDVVVAEMWTWFDGQEGAGS